MAVRCNECEMGIVPVPHDETQSALPPALRPLPEMGPLPDAQRRTGP